jgi:hypothetical protein
MNMKESVTDETPPMRRGAVACLMCASRCEAECSSPLRTRAASS